ncbi:MAG: PQQ-binding-like beta-propeller repeat protein, partial [Planctomycetales bacterium]|nr:PQQ-binding-like beta-propeller repeat protein [Planctomycetales bacterium]
MVNASPTGSGIAGVIVSANHDDRHTFAVHELQYDGGFKRFTPLDLGADGLPIGPDEALRLAEVEELRKKALNRNPVLTTKKIHPVDLFVSTNSGVLQSIDAETGRTHWSISVGSPNRPTSPPAANDWYVAVINGSQLFVVDRATGEPVLDRQLTTTPMVASSRSNMGPVMTNFGFETVNDAEVSVDWIYIPCTGGRLEAYSVANRATPPWFTTTRGNVSGRPVIGAGRVAWTSTNGYLQVADAQDHGLRFRLQTGEQIDASAAYLAPGKFFVGARNGYLYAIDETSENIDWEFSTAQPILDPPVAIEGDVIVTTQDRNMFCVDKDGNEKWMAPAIDSFLAASENRIYAVDDRGQLNVLSRKTGARLGPAVRLNSLPVVNTETDRVYVTSTLG